MGAPGLLVEARHGRRVHARKPQRPVVEDALAIDDMLQQFAGGPFSLRIGVIVFFSWDAFQKPAELPGVFPNGFPEIFFLHQVKIALVSLRPDNFRSWDHRYRIYSIFLIYKGRFLRFFHV